MFYLTNLPCSELADEITDILYIMVISLRCCSYCNNNFDLIESKIQHKMNGKIGLGKQMQYEKTKGSKEKIYHLQKTKLIYYKICTKY